MPSSFNSVDQNMLMEADFGSSNSSSFPIASNHILNQYHLNDFEAQQLSNKTSSFSNLELMNQSNNQNNINNNNNNSCLAQNFRVIPACNFHYLNNGSCLTAHLNGPHQQQQFFVNNNGHFQAICPTSNSSQNLNFNFVDCNKSDNNLHTTSSNNCNNNCNNIEINSSRVGNAKQHVNNNSKSFRSKKKNNNTNNSPSKMQILAFKNGNKRIAKNKIMTYKNRFNCD